jgi:hypothetical protein
MSSLAPFSMWKILFAQGMNWLVGAGKLDISAQSLRSSSCSWIWEYYLVHSAWQLTQYGKVIFETAVKIYVKMCPPNPLGQVKNSTKMLSENKNAHILCLLSHHIDP